MEGGCFLLWVFSYVSKWLTNYIYCYYYFFCLHFPDSFVTIFMQLSLKILTILTFSFSYNSILFTEHNFGIFKKSFVSKNWFNLFPKVSISLNTSFMKWHFTYFRVLTWYGTVQNKQFTGFKYIKIAGASRLCPWTMSGGIRAPHGDQQPWECTSSAGYNDQFLFFPIPAKRHLPKTSR